MTLFVRDIIDKYSKQYDNISVHISSSRSKSVQLDGYETESVDYCDGTSVTVRCVKDGKAVAGNFSGADGDAVETFLKNGAGAISKLPSDEFRIIPRYIAPEKQISAVDGNFKETDIGRLAEFAKEITSEAFKTDKRVKAVKQSGVQALSFKTEMISTAGPVLAQEKTLFSAGAYLIAEQDGHERDGFDSVSAVLLSDMDCRLAGRTAAENACSLLGARNLKTGKYHIAFSAAVMAEFLELIMELADGENIYKGISFFKDKNGIQIASSGFSLKDDPLLKNGTGSRSFDDEGQSCDIIEIIKDGVLNSCLHNSYTAMALNEKNNARAVLTSGGNLAVGCTNVSVETTAKGSPSEHVSEYLLITEVMGMHTADTVSGDFSVGISGIYVKDGVELHPFKEAVISGNLRHLLEGMIHIFDNRRTFGNITTADTLFDKMSVSGV